MLIVGAVFLANCAPLVTSMPPTETSVPAVPSQTEILSTPTLLPTTEPNPQETDIPTATLIPCRPVLDFCIEDGHFLLIRPISAEYVNSINPGYRYGTTINGEREPHHGVEFTNSSGTPVLAAAEGRVIFAAEDKSALFSPWSRFYGNLVVIQHDLPALDEPLYTLYAHLLAIHVEEGDVVNAGQQIGEVGWTGAAIGSHLHFEVRLGGQAYTDTRNPELWLMPVEENLGAIVTRVADLNGKLIRVPVVLEKVEGTESAFIRVANLEAYAPEKHPVGVDDEWQESYAVADLPIGQYRLSVVTAGTVYERFVEVRPGQVTVAYFIIE